MERYVRGREPWILLTVLAVVCAIAIGYAGATSTVAFGPYTSTWEGTSELRTMAGADDRELVAVRNTSQYGRLSSNDTVAFVFSPDERYGPADIPRLDRFVRDGGTLVVGDAFGEHANPLLADLDSTIRIHGDPLRDETEYDVSPDFPRTVVASNHSYVVGASTLVLNHGTVLDPGNATVLAHSSPYGYLDHDRTGDPSETDALDEYPVAAVEPVGNGTVLVISDPSVFINVMLERGDNRVILENVLDAHERVVFDVSHTVGLPPLALLVLILRESIILQLLIGALGLSAVWIGIRTDRLDRLRTRWIDPREPGTLPELDESRVRAYLEETHPDWDRDRLEQVTATILTHDREA